MLDTVHTTLLNNDVETNLKILIVDDEVTNLKILADSFDKNNEMQFEILRTLSAKKALKIAIEEKPSLIITDWDMPEMNGIELIRQLKSHEETKDIPVIMCTGVMLTSENLNTALEAGAADYIRKPVDIIELKARTNSMLQLGKSIRKTKEQNKELEEKNKKLINSLKKIDKVFLTLADVLPGMVLDNKYRLEEKIGSGGFGAVFKATDLTLKREVAIKILRPSSDGKTLVELERFRIEAISACRVNHPNAITVYDFAISSNGITYLVMEFLKGSTLTQELFNEGGPLTLKRTIEILVPICNVLAKTHEVGIVHRDIKLDNIFLHKTEEGEIVKVLDFGIAKLLGEDVGADMQNLTIDGCIIGTPNYLAPERINCSFFDGKSDIYSLGVIFYKLLTDRFPFYDSTGNIWFLFTQHLCKEPPNPRQINKDIPEEIEMLVMKMLAKKSPDRPTAMEIAEKLRAYSDKYFK